MSVLLPSIVNFALLIGIVVFFARKPLMAFLASRSDAVAHSMAEAKKVSDEAAKTKEVYEAKWKTAEAEAKQQLVDARAALERQKVAAIAAAHAEAERVKKESKLAGTGEIQKAKERLQREIIEKSVALTEKFLKTHLQDKDKHKLVNDYVEILNG